MCMGPYYSMKFGKIYDDKCTGPYFCMFVKIYAPTFFTIFRYDGRNLYL